MRLPLLLTLVISIFLASLPVVSTAAEVDPAVLKAQADRIAVIEKARPTVLAVFGGLPGASGGGSGVVISPDGYALTNFHVTKPCGAYMKCGMADGKLYDAVLVGLDPTGDIALIKLLGRDDFPCAKLGDSDKLSQGDLAYAMGNPFLLASNLKPTVTHGIVSGVRRYQYPSGTILEYTDCIQTDAAVNPGNSGGPLFNAKGELVGINGRCSFEKRKRVSVGVGYAISINQIKKFLGPLRSGRIVDHARLGAVVAFDDGGRVVVDEIGLGTDIYQRGIAYQDQILRVANRMIDSPNTMKNIIGIFPAGWRVPVKYRRDNQETTIYVQLPPLHRGSELQDAVSGKPKPKPKTPEKKPGEPEKKPGKPGKKPGTPKPGKTPPKMKKIPLNPLGQPDMKKLHPRIQKLLADAKKKELPEKIKKVYEKRIGFANYYFNKVETKRVYDAWSKATDREKLVGDWIFKTKDGTQFLLNRDGIKVTLNNGTEQHWGSKEDWTSKLAQDPTGGLCLALHFWHRLTTNGDKGFELFNYEGAYPTPRLQKEGTVLRDVLIGRIGEWACWFYFNRETGHLAEIEFFAQIGFDPCLVELRDYKKVDGKMVPTLLNVYRGDRPPFKPIKINSFKVGK